MVSTGRDSLPTGHVAALTSQPYQPSAPAQCLAFWYQLSASTPGEHQDPGGTSGWGGPTQTLPHGGCPGAGSLGVFVEQSGVRRRVLAVSSAEGDAWHRGHATVEADGDWQVRQGRALGSCGREGDGEARGSPLPPCTPAHLQVMFEVVGAGGDHGYIALDDLHVSDGACPEPGERGMGHPWGHAAMGVGLGFPPPLLSPSMQWVHHSPPFPPSIL